MSTLVLFLSDNLLKICILQVSDFRASDNTFSVGTVPRVDRGAGGSRQEVREGMPHIY